MARPRAVQELGAGALGSLCFRCSLCSTQLLQHGLFHQSLPLWVLHLPWPCLFFSSIHCPFLNMFPQRHHRLVIVGPVVGCNGSILSSAKPAVSSTEQSLTFSCTNKTNNDVLKHVTMLSVTCFSILSFTCWCYFHCFGKLSSIFLLRDLLSPCEMNTVMPHKALVSITGLYTSTLHLRGL